MTKLLTALALVLAFSAPAFANDWKNTDKNVDPATKTEKYIQSQDTNGDGMVTRDENKELGGNDWAKADANADGSLSKPEIQAFYGKAVTDSKAGM